jgi:hypothetical protein
MHGQDTGQHLGRPVVGEGTVKLERARLHLDGTAFVDGRGHVAARAKVGADACRGRARAFAQDAADHHRAGAEVVIVSPVVVGLDVPQAAGEHGHDALEMMEVAARPGHRPGHIQWPAGQGLDGRADEVEHPARCKVCCPGSTHRPASPQQNVGYRHRARTVDGPAGNLQPLGAQGGFNRHRRSGHAVGSVPDEMAVVGQCVCTPVEADDAGGGGLKRARIGAAGLEIQGRAACGASRAVVVERAVKLERASLHLDVTTLVDGRGHVTTRTKVGAEGRRGRARAFAQGAADHHQAGAGGVVVAPVVVGLDVPQTAGEHVHDALEMMEIAARPGHRPGHIQGPTVECLGRGGVHDQDRLRRQARGAGPAQRAAGPGHPAVDGQYVRAVEGSAAHVEVTGTDICVDCERAA